MSDPVEPLPFGTRLWFAIVCYFRVLFDGAFAARAFAVREAAALPPAPEEKPREKEPKRAPAKEPEKPPSVEPALQLLALFQREGRFVDFLEEDVTTFSDADVGAAARVVHEGCRKALRAHGKLKPIRDEEEGSKLTLDEVTPKVKLIGNVTGKAPFTGKLVHRGWRLEDLELPTAMPGHDSRVLAPAELEL